MDSDGHSHNHVFIGQSLKSYILFLDNYTHMYLNVFLQFDVKELGTDVAL